MTIPILAVSDETDPRLYSANVGDRLGQVALVVGCGDVPSGYLEFLGDALRRPVYFVHGNHVDGLVRRDHPCSAHEPGGGTDLAARVVRDPANGLILAGIPGSPRYGDGEPYQYEEWQIVLMILRMLPRLLWNRLRYGRFLDVLVTHAPPRDVNDRPDACHRGFATLRTFLHWFRPAYHLHGHIHLYDRSLPYHQRFEGTEVVNVFPYRVIEVAPALDAPSLWFQTADGASVSQVVSPADRDPAPGSTA